MDESYSFGYWVRRRRKALDLTQVELAQRIGCAESMLRKIEADERRPSKQVAVRIAQALEVPASERDTFLMVARAEQTVERLAILSTPTLPTPLPAALSAQRSSLPQPATPLIGREREVTRACELLQQAGVRLLTLTGPGGIGKTRLSIDVATALADRFADGVHYVSLAPIRDTALVIRTIAQTLGLPDTGAQPREVALLALLRERQMLLVLDNFEQLVGAAPDVAGLLAAAPELRLLITSRAPLRLAGEREYPVEPLALPSDDGGSARQPFPSASSYGRQALLHAAEPAPAVVYDASSCGPAVHLFVDRAQAVLPDFALTHANVAAVVAICQRLDGIPLAIELAAVCVRLFPPPALLARIEAGGRLPLLTRGARDMPARQQTIRATIDWSYQLLTSAEQALLARLGVFVGGFSMDSAEAIAGQSVFALLSALVEQSLVRVVGKIHGEPRFGMLEMVREYALERLAASGEEATTRHAHLAYYLALAEAAEPHLTGTEQEAWLQRLGAEHDNLRQALRWSLDQGDVTAALRLGGALWRFWYMRSHLGEGCRWLEQALAVSDGAAAPLRLKVLTGAGVLAHYQGNFSRAAGLFGDSLALARQLDDHAGIAEALKGLALVARVGGNFAAARAMYTEALALLRPLGDRGGIAHALTYQSVAAWMQGDYAAARALATEGLAIYRELGDRQGIATAANIGGHVASAERDDATAHALQSESLLLYRQLGDRRGSAKALAGLGEVAFDRGDYALARALGEESQALFLQVGDMWCTVEMLEQLARLAAVEGQRAPALDDSRRAAQIYGAADALRVAIGAPLPPHHNTVYHAAILAAARARLGEDECGTAWSTGRTLTLEQAIALATAQDHASAPERARLAPVADAGDASPAADRGHRDTSASLMSLSARELEVLRLVAEGLTDAQVAAHLTISPRTVQRHLSSIYSKLQVSSRTAAARLAIAQGLV